MNSKDRNAEKVAREFNNLRPAPLTLNIIPKDLFRESSEATEIYAKRKKLDNDHRNNPEIEREKNVTNGAYSHRQEEDCLVWHALLVSLRRRRRNIWECNRKN